MLLKISLQGANWSPRLASNVIATEVAVTEPVWVPSSVNAPEGEVGGKLMLQIPFNVDFVFEEVFSVKVRLMLPGPWWLSWISPIQEPAL